MGISRYFKDIRFYAIVAIGRVLPDTVSADALYLKMLYRYRMKENLDLEKPTKFNEKIQWMKLYNRNPLYTTLVDKFAVKEYIAKTLGKEYIIPTLGVWDHFDDIDFDKLPNQFVMKVTHDSGGLIICTDKSKLDLKVAKERINHALKRRYFKNTKEWPYKNVKPRIIAEEYLENNEEGLHDYKVWCFNGEPVYIQYITGRIGSETYESFYDLDWNLQKFSFHNPIMNNVVAKPERLSDIISACRVLAKGCPFVRCDFYVLEDGSIRFGEMTFFPMSGMEQWKPESMNLTLGKMIDLPNK